MLSSRYSRDVNVGDAVAGSSLRVEEVTAGSVVLFAGEHGGGLAFEVDVGFAADVDGHPVQGAAGQCPRGGAGVVGDGFGAAASGGEDGAGDAELAGLGAIRPSPPLRSP